MQIIRQAGHAVEVGPQPDVIFSGHAHQVIDVVQDHLGGRAGRRVGQIKAVQFRRELLCVLTLRRQLLAQRRP